MTQASTCNSVTDVEYPNCKVLLGDHSELEPPDPIPNSAVKRLCADGSVGPPHVRVGHRQAPHPESPVASAAGLFLWLFFKVIAGFIPADG